MIHGGMQYNAIQGLGHEPFKVGNLTTFEKLCPPPYLTGAGDLPRVLKLRHNI